MAIPRINVGASVRDLLHEVRLIRKCLEAQIERLDGIEHDLHFLSKIHPTGGLAPFAFGTGPVAYNLYIQQQSDGSIKFAIDGGHKFSLRPRLAEIFQFLASGDADPSGKDELVGWRSRTDVIKFLEASTGRSFKPR